MSPIKIEPPVLVLIHGGPNKLYSEVSKYILFLIVLKYI